MSEPDPRPDPRYDPALRTRRNRILGLVLAAIVLLCYFGIRARWS